MRHILIWMVAVILISSCKTSKQNTGTPYDFPADDTLITQSLFNDKASTISEDNIQKILEGNYKLPPLLRVAIVKLENSQSSRNYYAYRTDEAYLKTQQSYLDSFTQKFRQSPRVTRMSIIPDLLVSKPPSFTSIREAGVRMQADIVVVYAITSDIYSKYKLFSKSDVKAFATTQLIVLDVRTGLVPFSSIVTKDYLSQKGSGDLDQSETRQRILNEAVLLTINEIGQQVINFLKTPS